MDELVRWLGQQLDEDERDAEARRGIFPSPGVREDGSVALHVRPGGNMAITWYRNPAEGWDDMAKLRNWADTENGWTQERVLREIDAKRQLVAEHALNGWVCSTCDNGEVGQVFPCPTLRLLALPYEDRPGYRDDWRP
ncbi:DUF6221 family protein [Streptomyces sp. NPDC005774]|uniref:DUF6221 family protein n=1 Tax=Streptomyces sp. NPDC005774 TaxID=3364728 RepID=UPI0036ADEF74